MLKRFQQKGITILVSTPYMDEAALCDRIGLIQKGKILKIDTPENIIKKYDKTIYDVRAKDTYQLIQDLKQYPSQYSVYVFGAYIHYIDKEKNFDPKDLQKYLESKKQTNIEIHIAKPTIEDVFMDLYK